MITLALAQQLSAAGLRWNPNNGDQFAVPQTGMDDHVFVISDQMVTIQQIHGAPMLTFHGSAEWALDHLVLTDVVWLPSETHLRELVAAYLPPAAELRLARSEAGYTCTIGLRSNLQSFTATTGEDAYGMALLNLLASAN